MTLRRWVRLLPDFAREVAQACEDREDWYRDQILMIAEAVTPETVEAARRLGLGLGRRARACRRLTGRLAPRQGYGLSGRIRTGVAP